MNVGFLGLGNMGRPMAANLMAAGHRLTVYNRTRSRADDLAANGAEVAETPAAACAAEVVITMLADDDSVTDAVLGAHGVLSALSPSAIHVCMSTIARICPAVSPTPIRRPGVPLFPRRCSDDRKSRRPARW